MKLVNCFNGSNKFRLGVFAGAMLGVTGMAAQEASAALAPTATGTISVISTGASNSYGLTLKDASTSPSPIGSVWEAWVPGQFYMASAPTIMTAPTGWTSTLTTGNGEYGIQWVASSASFDVPVGGSLSGFGFSTPDSPTAIFGNSTSFPSTPVLTSVAYDAGLFSDAGTHFVFAPTAVPEPNSLALIAAPLGLLMRRRARRSVVAESL